MRYYPNPEESLTVKEVNRVTEEVFAIHGRGAFSMPPKVYINLPTGDFRTMPAYIPSLDVAGVKIVSVHPQNSVLDLPTVMATTVLLDIQTGEPVAVLNATALTNLRTGAAGGVAAGHLAARRDVIVGLVGSGRQASAQLDAIACELEIREVRIWSRDQSHADKFCEREKAHDCRSLTLERVCDADVVVTTTPARGAIVQADWIHGGTHINAIGADAPGKQELAAAILSRASVYVDDIRQAVHSGEINVPISNGEYSEDKVAGTLGEVVLGKKGRAGKDEVTIFDSTGLAIQDLAIARLATAKASCIELPFLKRE
jgi:alanine dehydrogenase